MPIFYEITNPNSDQKSYLFGTAHSNSAQTNTLSIEVISALKASRMILIEHDINSLSKQLPQLINKYQADHDAWLSKADNYLKYTQQLVSIFPDYSIADISALRDKPYYVIGNLINKKVLTFDTELSLDEAILLYGKKNKKSLGYLENLTTKQIDHITDESTGYQSKMDSYSYSLSLVESGEYARQAGAIENYYLSQDDIKASQPVGVKNFLISGRDKIMSKNMLRHINNGNAFAAVGFFHLPGIVNHLQKEGYTVTPIELSARTYYLPDYLKQDVKIIQPRTPSSIIFDKLISLGFSTSLKPKLAILMSFSLIIILLDVLKSAVLHDKTDEMLQITGGAAIACFFLVNYFYIPPDLELNSNPNHQPEIENEKENMFILNDNEIDMPEEVLDSDILILEEKYQNICSITDEDKILELLRSLDIILKNLTHNNEGLLLQEFNEFIDKILTTLYQTPRNYLEESITYKIMEQLKTSNYVNVQEVFRARAFNKVATKLQVKDAWKGKAWHFWQRSKTPSGINKALNILNKPPSSLNNKDKTESMVLVMGVLAQQANVTTKERAPSVQQLYDFSACCHALLNLKTEIMRREVASFKIGNNQNK